MNIRSVALPICFGFAFALAAPLAHAAEAQNNGKTEHHGGTLKGAAIGGLAGHEMGGHTKTGAAVGAAVGHHEKAKSQKGEK